MTVDYSGQLSALLNPTTATAFSFSAPGSSYAVIVPKLDTMYKLSVTGTVTFDSTSSAGVQNTIGIYFGNPTNIPGSGLLTSLAITRPTATPYTPQFALQYLLHVDSGRNKILYAPAPLPTSNQDWILTGGGGGSTGVADLFSVLPNIFLTSTFSQSKAGNSASINHFKLEEFVS